MRKNIVLFLALALPILIVFFLNLFGKNEYDVAPMFQHVAEGEKPPEGCLGVAEIPYSVPDSVWRWQLGEGNQLLLFNVEPNNTQTTKYLSVVEEEFSDQISIVDVTKELSIRPCIFLLQQDQNLALIDKEGRIRGLYNGKSLEEVDRMVAELKIILKKY